MLSRLVESVGRISRYRSVVLPMFDHVAEGFEAQLPWPFGGLRAHAGRRRA
jgi:hypothetical protein